MIAKEGYPFIIFAAVLLLIVAILPKFILVIVAVLLLAMMFWFFRDPERVPPVDAKSVVSAADGKVVEISEFMIDGIKFKKVSVFMNVFSVHVNRAPFEGKVVDVKHINGEFMPADRPEVSTRNERCEIHFDTKHGRLIAVQVAGLVARRTVAYVNEGMGVSKGDRIGMIKFSSRVDHYLPESVNITTSIGDNVTAGVSEIASFA